MQINKFKQSAANQLALADIIDNHVNNLLISAANSLADGYFLTANKSRLSIDSLLELRKDIYAN